MAHHPPNGDLGKNMAVETVNGVLKHCATTGALVFAGYTKEKAIEGLNVSPVAVYDPEDGSDNRWVLTMDTPIAPLTAPEIDTLRTGEAARIALAKLTDEEVAALGLTRAPA